MRLSMCTVKERRGEVDGEVPAGEKHDQVPEILLPERFTQTRE